jgi:nicotinate-nucleotide pyrophosphorylase (carboxylating)
VTDVLHPTGAHERLGTLPDPLPAEIERVVAAALEEDLGSGDATSRSTLPAGARCAAVVVSRAQGIVSGLPLVEAVFDACPGQVSLELLREDGDSVGPGTALAALEGDATTILSGERTALNFLAHLSGIATLTGRYVEAVAGTQAMILDTRKTTPGLRQLEKYAVRCGGGTNHRLGLYDAILIKDNHLMLSGTLEQAVARARAASDLEITVEVEDLRQLTEALDARADRILLDNMSADMLRTSVEIVAGRVPLEASGGITLESVAEVASTGVDFISIGSITHSAPALDVSLEVS